MIVLSSELSSTVMCHLIRAWVNEAVVLKGIHVQRMDSLINFCIYLIISYPSGEQKKNVDGEVANIVKYLALGLFNTACKTGTFFRESTRKQHIGGLKSTNLSGIDKTDSCTNFRRAICMKQWVISDKVKHCPTNDTLKTLTVESGVSFGNQCVSEGPG